MGTSEETSNSIASGSLEPMGQLRGASNGSLLCRDDLGDLFVYKPVSGESPLWDFTRDTLCRREVAAANLDGLLGWDLVPPTRWTDEGPMGPGMVQQWVEEVDELRPVNIFDTHEVPTGWLSILQAIDQDGSEVTLAHEPSEQLAQMALFDAVSKQCRPQGRTRVGGQKWSGIRHRSRRMFPRRAEIAHCAVGVGGHPDSAETAE